VLPSENELIAPLTATCSLAPYVAAPSNSPKIGLTGSNERLTVFSSGAAWAAVVASASTSKDLIMSLLDSSNGASAKCLQCSRARGRNREVSDSREHNVKPA